MRRRIYIDAIELMEKMMSKVYKDGCVRLLLRIKPQVKQAMEELAKHDNRSVTNYIETIILKAHKEMKSS